MLRSPKAAEISAKKKLKRGGGSAGGGDVQWQPGGRAAVKGRGGVEEKERERSREGEKEGHRESEQKEERERERERVEGLFSSSSLATTGTPYK